MIINQLAGAHVEEAVHLFSTLYHRQRQETPILDRQNGQSEKIMEMLTGCLKRHPGVAAWENGKMLGYMTGFFLDELLGPSKGVLSTEGAPCIRSRAGFRDLSEDVSGDRATMG
jgi:hypothetical protein